MFVFRLPVGQVEFSGLFLTLLNFHGSDYWVYIYLIQVNFVDPLMHIYTYFMLFS